MKLNQYLTSEENEQLGVYRAFIESAGIENSNDPNKPIRHNDYNHKIVDGEEDVIFEDGKAKLYSTGSWNLQAFSASIRELYQAAAYRIAVKFPPKEPGNEFVDNAVGEMLKFAASIQGKITAKFQDEIASEEKAAKAQREQDNTKCREDMLRVVTGAAGGRRNVLVQELS